MRNTENLERELAFLGTQQFSYERSVINLIASDNATPLLVSPKYRGHIIQEGIAGHRPFAGASIHDKLENLAAQIACDVFDAAHANVQPHSCSQANQAVYHALLEPGDPIIALNFQAGGHLTHGLKRNFSGRFFSFHHYGVRGESSLIDYDEVAQMAEKLHPKLIVCGSSSYPRLFDAERLRTISDNVGAHLMFDLSHEAGLIAAGVIPNPVPLADAATMSMDKTLRGPHGGIVLCKKHLADRIDRGVHPGTQSSFPISKLTLTADALLKTQTIDFQEYAKRVLSNAKTFERRFNQFPGLLITGGTDKHLVVLDVKTVFGMDGNVAEQRLEKIGILTSRQTLPTDTSFRSDQAGGLRLGSAWATSRGYEENDFNEICEIIIAALSSTAPEITHLKGRVSSIVERRKVRDVWL